MKTREDVRVTIEKILMDYSNDITYSLTDAINDILALMDEYKYSESKLV